MRNRPALTAEDVKKILAACEAEAVKNKWNVTIAVTDDAGYLLGLHRMDGAGGITAKVALGKAEGAALTGRPSKFHEDRLKERIAFLNFPAGLPIQGAVPILHQNERVGAIGVSGVQSHEDEQIANAGLAALNA
jgi:glc operon protein GlcG